MCCRPRPAGAPVGPFHSGPCVNHRRPRPVWSYGKQSFSQLRELFFHSHCDKLVTGKFAPQQRAVGRTDGAVVCSGPLLLLSVTAEAAARMFRGGRPYAGPDGRAGRTAGDGPKVGQRPRGDKPPARCRVVNQGPRTAARIGRCRTFGREQDLRGVFRPNLMPIGESLAWQRANTVKVITLSIRPTASAGCWVSRRRMWATSPWT